MVQAGRILGIAGNLRRESYNRAALRAAMHLVPAGATLEAFELDGLPGFNQDEEGNPPARVVELKRRIREADAVLIVTPEYNDSHLRQIFVFLNINQPEVMIGNAATGFDPTAR